MMNVAFDYIPFSTIQPKRFASVQVDFNGCNVGESSLL